MKKLLLVLVMLFSLNLYCEEWDLYYFNDYDTSMMPKPNVIFLMDVSGSMNNSAGCKSDTEFYPRKCNCYKRKGWSYVWNEFPQQHCDWGGTKPAGYYGCQWASCRQGDRVSTRMEEFKSAIIGMDPLGRYTGDGLLDYLANAASSSTAGSGTHSQDRLSTPVNLLFSTFPARTPGNMGADIHSSKNWQDVNLVELNNSNKHLFRDMIKGLSPDGGTPMGSALVSVWDHLYNNNDKLLSCRENVVFLITDGEPSLDGDQWAFHGKTNHAYYHPFSSFTKNYNTNEYVLDVAKYIYGGHVIDDDFDHIYYDYYGRPTFLHVDKDEIHSEKYRKYFDLYWDYNKFAQAGSWNGVDYIESVDSCPNGNCRGNKIRVVPISIYKNVDILNKIASTAGSGHDKAFHASSREELIHALKTGLDAVAAQGASAAAAPSVSMNGGFSGNNLLISTFEAESNGGHWKGNIRKFCFEGPDCIFQKAGEDEKEDMVHKTDYNSSMTEAFSKENRAGDDMVKSVVSHMGVNKKFRERANDRKIYYPGDDDDEGFKLAVKNDFLGRQNVYNFMNGYKFASSKSGGNGFCNKADGDSDAICKRRENIAGDFWHSSSLIVGDKFLAGSNAGFLSVFDFESGEEIKAIIPNKEVLKRHFDGVYAESQAKEQLFGVDLTPQLILDEKALKNYEDVLKKYKELNGESDKNASVKRTRAKGNGKGKGKGNGNGNNPGEVQNYDLSGMIFVGYGRGGKGFDVFTTKSLLEENVAPVSIFEDNETDEHHNFVYSAPQFIEWGYNDEDNEWHKGGDYLVVTSGYHEVYDEDRALANKDLKNVKQGVSFYSYSGYEKDKLYYADTIKKAMDNGSEKEILPVVGSVRPFNSRVDQLRQFDIDYINAHKKEADLLYFADIKGNLYSKRNRDNIARKNGKDTKLVFSIPQLLDDNESDLNVFGTPAVYLRKRDEDGNTSIEGKSEIWVSVGTADPTRPIDDVVGDKNKVVAIRHLKENDQGKYHETTGIDDFDSFFNAGESDENLVDFVEEEIERNGKVREKSTRGLDLHGQPDSEEEKAEKIKEAKEKAAKERAEKEKAKAREKYWNRSVESICKEDENGKRGDGCPVSDDVNGWYLNLDDNEMVVGDVLAYNKWLFFTVFQKEKDTVQTKNVCSITLKKAVPTCMP